MVVFEWVCTAGTLIGVFLMAIKHYRRGWKIGIAANAGWALFAFFKDLDGLLALSALLVVFGLCGLSLLPKEELQWSEEFDCGPPTIIPTGPQAGEERCCQLNAKFITGLIGERHDIPAPIGLAAFIENWNWSDKAIAENPQRSTGVGDTVLLRMRFCPFCGNEDVRYKKIPHE